MIASALVEMLLSALLAPVFLFFHAKFVLFSLLGKKVEWNAQQRGCGEQGAWREAREVFGLTTLLGLGTCALTCWLTPGYFLWLLPIVLGWVLAIPLTALVGDWRMGNRFRAAGFFLVPSEVNPPREVCALRHVSATHRVRTADPAAAAVIDPVVHHLLPDLVPSDYADLHRQIWATPAAELDPAWARQLAHLKLVS